MDNPKGVNEVNALNISRNSIQRARASKRATRLKSLRSKCPQIVPLPVHWDGKLMEDLTSHEHIDHLSVLISGIGVEQLLGILKLSTGSISPSIYCHPMFDR